MEFAFPIIRILPVQRIILHYFSALDLGINVRLSTHFTGGAGLANPQTRVLPGSQRPSCSTRAWFAFTFPSENHSTQPSTTNAEMNPSTHNSSYRADGLRPHQSSSSMHTKCMFYPLKLRRRKYGADAAAAEMKEFYSVVINSGVPSFGSAVVTGVTERCQAEVCAGWYPQVPALPFPLPAPAQDAAAPALLQRLGAVLGADTGLLTPDERVWGARSGQTGSCLH